MNALDGTEVHRQAGASGDPASPGPGRPMVTSPVPRDVWDSLVRSDPAAVVTQSLAWRDAIFASGRYRDVSRLYEFGSGRRIVLPLARRRLATAWTATAASWPRDLGVCGPICEDGQASAAEATAVLADLAGRGAVAVEVRLPEGTAGTWLAAASGYQVEERAGHVLDLAGGFSEVWSHRFRGTARTAVRKAERSGVEVEVDRSGQALQVFFELYEKSIRRWAAMQHEPVALTRWRTMRVSPPRMLAAVAEHFGQGCEIWVARVQGMPIATLVVLRSGSNAKYWRGAMDKELATPVRANEYLHSLAIEQACRDGCRWYEMGQTRPSSPLAAFKEKLGAGLQPRYTLRTEHLPFDAALRGTRNMIKSLIGFRDV
jgi:Acetyltransferase (GNAT) domain